MHPTIWKLSASIAREPTRPGQGRLSRLQAHGLLTVRAGRWIVTEAGAEVLEKPKIGARVRVLPAFTMDDPFSMIDSAGEIGEVEEIDGEQVVVILESGRKIFPKHRICPEKA